MTKEKILLILMGNLMGICISSLIGLSTCNMPHKDELGWYQFKLVIDMEDVPDLPYKVYDNNGEYYGKITAADLDKNVH